MEKLLYTRPEAEAAIGCKTTRLYELIGTGKLRARKLGKRLMIEGDSLREFVASLPIAEITTVPRRPRVRELRVWPPLQQP
jgi:hypothetical protein